MNMQVIDKREKSNKKKKMMKRKNFPKDNS